MVPRNSRPWKEEVKDLLSFHPGERRGLAVLLGLCLLGALWVTWEQWIRPRVLPEKDFLEASWRSWQDSLAAAKPEEARRPRSIQPFNFDPNKLSTEEWMRLGLTERQARSIQRYGEKGGTFRTKRDLARMRVVDSALYALWAPYILLPDSLPRKSWEARGTRADFPARDSSRWGQRTPASPDLRRERVELNTADSAALVAVRGIGPAFARAILRYRERLGGFTDLDQLREVYILRDKPDAVQRIQEQLTVDKTAVRHIDLNQCTPEDLAAHPYVGWKLAKALVAYRGQHGPFRQVADISGCALVTDSIRDRLAPYLAVGP